MIRKYHNQKLQTTPWHREEEVLNHHETPGRQTKQSNQPPPPPPPPRTITDSHNGSNNKQKVNNNRTTALERTAAQATGGPKCTPLAPNLRPRFCRRRSTRKVQPPRRPSNQRNASPRRNTLTKLTHHDETKKRAHDPQTVRAKENLKLSHDGSSYR